MDKKYYKALLSGNSSGSRKRNRSSPNENYKLIEYTKIL